MENSSDNNQPGFWNIRYAGGKTPWDFGGVPAALKSFLDRSTTPGRILIPGCGAGYEVQAFHAAGYDVTAIDFSPAAIDRARQVLGTLAERVILGDFFTYDFGPNRFELIYERTFLCSMTPSRWPAYVKRISELLAPAGRFIGVFLYGPRTASGPPFPLTEAEAGQLFNENLQLMRSEPITDSLPLFHDMETWQEWRKLH